MSVKRRDVQGLIAFVSILLFLAIDQYSKWLVRINLKIGDSIPIIKNAIHITSVRNTGAAFGLFKNNALIFTVISIVAIVFISTLILDSIKKEKFLSKPLFDSGLIFTISGAIGNLIDRVTLGYVVDFIDLRIWPVFNVADSLITIGTVLLIISFILHRA